MYDDACMENLMMCVATHDARTPMMTDDMPSCIGLEENIGAGERERGWRGGWRGGGWDGGHVEGGSRAGDNALTSKSRGIE